MEKQVFLAVQVVPIDYEAYGTGCKISKTAQYIIVVPSEVVDFSTVKGFLTRC